MEDLQTRLSVILGWLHGGEDVMVKGRAPALPPPEEAEVDWRKSAAFRDRTGEPVLSQEDLDELFDEMRGAR